MIIDVNHDPNLFSETGKIRPCIIVNNNIYNHRVPVIQVVTITNWKDKKAKIKTNMEDHLMIEIDQDLKFVFA